MADDTAVLLGVEEDALEKDERQQPNPRPPPPPPPPPPMLGRATSNATAVMTSQYNGKTRMVAAEAMALSRKTMINVFFSFFSFFCSFFFFFLVEERSGNGMRRRGLRRWWWGFLLLVGWAVRRRLMNGAVKRGG